MIFLRILLILALFIFLLCLVRVGIQVRFTEDGTTVQIRLSRIRIQVYPGKKSEVNDTQKAKKAQKAKKSADKQPSADQKPKKMKMPQFTLADIKDVVRVMLPPLKRALKRTRRGIRIDPMDLHYTVGAATDPAAGAELYGYLHSGIWAGMPVLEQLIVIPKPHIHIGIDFDTARSVLLGRIAVTIRIGTLLAVAFALAIPGIKWFLAFTKKDRTEEKTVASKVQKG